jgi:hypothetical protein
MEVPGLTKCKQSVEHDVFFHVRGRNERHENDGKKYSVRPETNIFKMDLLAALFARIAKKSI